MIIRNVEIFKINTMVDGLNYLFRLESNIRDIVNEPIAISQGTGEIVYGVADNFKVEKDYIVCDIEIAEPLPTRFSNTIIPVLIITRNHNNPVITKIERLYFSNDPHLFDELNNNLKSAKSHISNYTEVFELSEPLYRQGHYHEQPEGTFPSQDLLSAHNAGLTYSGNAFRLN